MYNKELTKLKKLMNEDLWGLLADQGCMIAGGAVTSVFTNKPVNDIDVYFPNKEAFTKVMQEIIDLKYRPGVKYEKEYGLGHREAMIQIVTNKAVLLKSDYEQDVQFVIHNFYETPMAIFADFDFTVCMGALKMQTDSWFFHPDFFKHNAQRHLHFNPGTSYPLISALRIAKYKEKGFNISKAQFMKTMFAVNAKNIDSWEKLMEELGGMYGTQPQEIFDTTQPFDIQAAMQRLDEIEIKDYMKSEPYDNLDEIVKKIPHAFTDEVVKLVEEYKEPEYNRYGYLQFS